MKRRDFLKVSGSLSAQIAVGGALGEFLGLGQAAAATGLPLQSLIDSFDPNQGVIVVPTSADFAKQNISFNQRTQLAPQVRVIASHPQAVRGAVTWAVGNGVPFAIRSGGHSYEGFSQSRGLVIDVRGLNQIQVDKANNLVTVGSGCSLGSIYMALAPLNLAIPAGSCFPVGVAGHTLGGGFGLLARSFGLACDNVQSLTMVDARGQLLNLSATENPDLFWAVRGGGNGNFGVVTEFVFHTHSVDKVVTFGLTWDVSSAEALPIARAWQSWLGDLPDSVCGTMHFGKGTSGGLRLHLAGWCLDSQSVLQNELDRLQNNSATAHSMSVNSYDFIDAAHHFNGDSVGYQSVFMKAKSDYVRKPLSDAGFLALFHSILSAARPIAVMADSYGGAVNRVKREATAFVHRGDVLYSLQYYMEWSDNTATDTNMAMLRTLYASMRPLVSGEAYVNYCDLELPNYAEAYWAENLPRLRQLKGRFDPANVFKTAQGILAQ